MSRFLFILLAFLLQFEVRTSFSYLGAVIKSITQFSFNVIILDSMNVSKSLIFVFISIYVRRSYSFVCNYESNSFEMCENEHECINDCVFYTYNEMANIHLQHIDLYVSVIMN